MQKKTTTRWTLLLLPTAFLLFGHSGNGQIEKNHIISFSKTEIYFNCVFGMKCKDNISIYSNVLNQITIDSIYISNDQLTIFNVDKSVVSPFTIKPSDTFAFEIQFSPQTNNFHSIKEDIIEFFDEDKISRGKIKVHSGAVHLDYLNKNTATDFIFKKDPQQTDYFFIGCMGGYTTDIKIFNDKKVQLHKKGLSCDTGGHEIAIFNFDNHPAGQYEVVVENWGNLPDNQIEKKVYRLTIE